MQFSQVGEFASSKSAMKTFAPELSALITIFRSTGPVISTRRSAISSGNGATAHSPSRTGAVSARKSGTSPAFSRSSRSARRTSSSARRARNSRSRSVRNSTASGVRTSSTLIGASLARRSPRAAGDAGLVVLVVPLTGLRARARSDLGPRADRRPLPLRRGRRRLGFHGLLPDTVLRQETLSERFEVCPTPVREALRRLAALGLVSFEPNRGVRVRSISAHELHEAFLVRAELEALATEMATPRMRPDDLAELDAIERRFGELTLELREQARSGEGRDATLFVEWMHT